MDDRRCAHGLCLCRTGRQQRQLSALNIAQSLVSGVQAPTAVGSIDVTKSTIGSLASLDSDADCLGDRSMWKQTLSTASKTSEAPLIGQTPGVEEEIREDQKSTSYGVGKLVTPDKERIMNDGSLGCLDNLEESTRREKKQTGRVQAKHDTIADQIAEG